MVGEALEERVEGVTGEGPIERVGDDVVALLDRASLTAVAAVSKKSFGLTTSRCTMEK